jgi:hypothetical protein
MFDKFIAFINYLCILALVLQQYDTIFIDLPPSLIETEPPLIQKKIKKNKEREVVLKMKTRSQTREEIKREEEERERQEREREIKDKKKEVSFEIDFDEASKAWRANKVVLKNGCFRYKKRWVNK